MNNLAVKISGLSDNELFTQELEEALSQSNKVLGKAKQRIGILETKRIELSMQVTDLTARLSESEKVNEALLAKIVELQNKSIREIAVDVGLSRVDGQRLDVVLRDSTRGIAKTEQGHMQKAILSRLKEEYGIAWYSGFAAVDVEGLIDAIKDLATEMKKSGKFKRA